MKSKIIFFDIHMERFHKHCYFINNFINLIHFILNKSLGFIYIIHEKKGASKMLIKTKIKIILRKFKMQHIVKERQNNCVPITI